MCNAHQKLNHEIKLDKKSKTKSILVITGIRVERSDGREV